MLLEVTRQAMQEFTQVYVILDALDECTQRSELMDMVEAVAGWQLDNLHLPVTSRKERDIETCLENYVGEEDAICLQRDIVDQDIQRYVQQRLRDKKSLAKWTKDPAISQEVEDALMQGAHGMFRWAVCQLDTLAKCRNLVMLRNSLGTLPQTLDQTYDRILTAISKEDCVYAMRILQWLTFSARPLSVTEVAEVVAIDVARDLAFNRDEVLVDPLEALDICSSLVTITKNEEDGRLEPTQQIIALAHYSVKEFLVSDRIRQGSAIQYSMQEATCQSAITRGSLKYLVQLQQPLERETLQVFALARYSAEFWSSHLRKTGDEGEQASQLAASLMAKEQPAYLTWIRLHDPDRPWEEPNLKKSADSIHVPLYYAALLGLSTVTKLLLDQGAKVNAQGGEYGNALQAASEGGHEQVVKTLLNKGAEVNAQGGRYGNALQAASFRGHEAVVKLLLNRDADVNAQGGDYGNALHAAAYGGHEQLLELLISKYSISRLQDYYGRTLLWWAAAGGNIATVETLMNQHNINPQTADRFGRKPSWIATKKRHGAISALLNGYIGEIDKEQEASPKVSNENSHLKCDVCTSSIPKSAHFIIAISALVETGMCVKTARTLELPV
ncbi:hypothetical protein CFE70_001353 [Pyrenophora teres f. teres 0-1]|nr:hypothetical protein P3342_001676 [Pyrenophora teres f. teres]